MQPQCVVSRRLGLPPPGRRPFRHPDTLQTSINRAVAANQLRTRSSSAGGAAARAQVLASSPYFSMD